MSDVDHIIVGSGINALVCAATLGAKGARVLVLERNDRIVLSERDTLKVLEALENPPAPNEKMIAAAKSLPADL